MSSTGGMIPRLGRVAAFGSSRRGNLETSPAPGVLNAMNHGNGGKNRNEPQYRCHHVEQCADNDQHQALRTFHESNFAGANERLGASSGVADHDGADHDYSAQNHIKKAPAARIKNQ